MNSSINLSRRGVDLGLMYNQNYYLIDRDDLILDPETHHNKKLEIEIICLDSLKLRPSSQIK